LERLGFRNEDSRPCHPASRMPSRVESYCLRCLEFATASDSRKC
jgi:hypothetical protein